MKFNINKVFPVFFLVLMSIVLMFKIQFSYDNCNGFSFGDWLINYQDGGFKRRGLLGSFVFFMYNVFHVKIRYTAFFFQFLFNFLFLFYVVKLLNLKKHNILEYFFLFTPFCLWGIFSDCAIGTRKDGVLWFLMAFFAYYLASGKFKGVREYVFYLLLFISVFIHESFIFYAPNFVVLYLFLTKSVDYKKIIFILISLYFPIAILLSFGVDTLGSSYTLEILKDNGVKLQHKDNIFIWKESQFVKVDFYKKYLSGYLLYLISFSLQVLFAVYYMKIRRFENKDKKKIIFSFVVCLLLAIPLYLIAIDFGRWLYSHFIFLFIFIISLLPKAEIERQFFFRITQKEIIFVSVVIFSVIIYRVPSYYNGIQIGLPLKWMMGSYNL